MDRFQEMRVFVRVAETRSFRRAAQDLGLPPSTVTDVIKRAENRLGLKLLDRTTRVVVPTSEGEVWYHRCKSILGEIEDAETELRDARPTGRLRVDVHGTLARHFMFPNLPAFLDSHPGVSLHLSEGDRLVDLVREGVDCVVRVGTPADSDLVARKLGELREVTIASPAYIRRFGLPRNPDALEGHRMIAFRSSATGTIIPLEFGIAKERVERTLPAAMTVTSGECMVRACQLGMGLVQVPRYHVADQLRLGELVEVLPETPPSPSPVFALYPRGRQMSPRVRVFLDWVSRIDFA